MAGEVLILEMPDGCETWFLWTVKPCRKSKGIFYTDNLKNLTADKVVKTGSPASIGRWVEEREEHGSKKECF